MLPESAVIPILFAGLGILALGVFLLLVAAFRQRIWWGIGCVVFPPLLLLFSVRHWRRARWPLLLLLVGGVVTAVPYVIARQGIAIDLGPLERTVDGELHITLTGWDRDDYSVLSARPDTVVLQMANTDVTDQTLKYLAGMKHLRELDLNDTQVTDEGLRALQELPDLKTLRLRGTRVSDAGLKEVLAPMPSLMQLDLRGTAVSREAGQAWRAAQPGRRLLQ